MAGCEWLEHGGVAPTCITGGSDALFKVCELHCATVGDADTGWGVIMLTQMAVLCRCARASSVYLGMDACEWLRY